MEKRQVRLETSGSSGMPSGLHLNYEEDFLNYQSHQVPGIFTDPLFLPNMVNSVYKLVMPPVLSGAPPFTAAKDHPTIPLESVDDRDGTVPPSPLPSTVGLPAAERSKVGLPSIPLVQDLQETTVLVQPHVVLPANRDPLEGEGFSEE